jgi:hypothetical protein
MAVANSLAGLKWNFADVNAFCVESKTKHELKGFKYYNEKYIHDVSGELYSHLYGYFHR